jgi:hypothetical protein
MSEGLVMMVPFVVLAVVGVAGLGVIAGIAAYKEIQRRKGLIEGPTSSNQVPWLDTPPAAPPRPRGVGAPAQKPAAGKSTDWIEGADLLRYPARLDQLESELRASHVEAEQQAGHLKARQERLSGKDDRAELAARYEADAQMLERRTASMRKVMALVWRTRVILLLRAHVAITARRRPELGHLPEGDIPSTRLRAAAEAYDQAAESIRKFVSHIDERLADIKHTVPSPSSLAEVSASDKAVVERELEEAQGTYRTLRDQMDRLADTLSYLADRCHTRQVVEGAAVTLTAEAESDSLFEEVSNALSALHDLSELGDRALADSAMDNLAEDISHLERAGLDAQAAAEAELEVSRLLEQFPGGDRD